MINVIKGESEQEEKRKEGTHGNTRNSKRNNSKIWQQFPAHKRKKGKKRKKIKVKEEKRKIRKY